MTNEDLEVLRKVRRLAQEIEESSLDGKFPEDLLAKLFFLMAMLGQSEDPELKKIAAIQDHLHPGMTLRHFMNFMIPVERLLGQRVREDDFLITKKDRPAKSPEKFPLVFVLENIRSSFNVGSIFRLADGVGASEVHLCGYTPKPDRKTALGTESLTETRHWSSLDDAIVSLRDRGFLLWGLETAEKTTSLFDWEVQGPTALIVGNERFGLEAMHLAKMAGVLELPMSGVKNSLNVVNALSAVAFEWKRQWTSK